MNFGKILDEWEQNREKRAGNPKKEERSQDFEAMLERYELIDKDRELEGEKPLGPGRRTLRRMEHQRSLDLHGYTQEEGLEELKRFILHAHRDGIQKVLIIHGKGKHSPKGSVLRESVRTYLAESPVIGETGVPKRTEGGDGATWALLRYRSR